MATLMEALESPNTDQRTSNPFLWGRQAILDHLENTVRQLENGRGRIVMLEGAMGMGLDAIMEHMAFRFAETGRCQVLRGDFTDLAGGETVRDRLWKGTWAVTARSEVS